MQQREKQERQILVVGAGIAGIAAAQELARLGISVLVIEKGPFIGGHAAHLACKATDRCLKCNDCLVEDRLRAVADKASLLIRTRTQITHVERTDGGFHVSLISAPDIIDPKTCANCGVCFEKCPEAANGAVMRAPSPNVHPFYAVDPSKCGHFRGKECAICESACPEGAVHLDGEEKAWSVDAAGVVVATGFTPYDPGEMGRYGLTRFKNVVTAMALEKMLRNRGGILRTSDRTKPRKVAFVQCVGSRNMRLNHEFCSRVCCGYALRMGLKLVHDDPGLEVTVFYMDVQNFGKDFKRYYRQAKAKMRLLRGLPGDFYAAKDDGISVSYFEEKSGMNLMEDFDMIVLSVGLMPGPSNEFFAEELGLRLNEDAFLYVPESMTDAGIVVAGTAEGPMDVAESISHAESAALAMYRYLEKNSH